MLYLVHMTVTPPAQPDVDFEQRKRDERDMALRLQVDGVWRHLWRVVGRYENYSVFDVPSHDALHELLIDLPLFPYLDINVTPLATHPSALSERSESAGTGS